MGVRAGIIKSMDALERKRISVVTKYATENFTQGDWFTFGQLTGQLPYIQGHGRLLKSLSFGDDDYDSCVAEVLDKIFTDNVPAIDEVIDHFDIDLWYQQRDPEKYHRVFSRDKHARPGFWKADYFKAFICHLDSNKEKISYLKAALEGWGISSFIAHQDIKPTEEWESEIEAGLNSMDLLIALIEPGFRDSEWTDQEIGHALGRGIDVLPLIVGMKLHGFIAKIQGIQVKDKIPSDVAEEIVPVLLRKPRHRIRLLSGMSRAIAIAPSAEKIKKIQQLDKWKVVSDDQMRDLLQTSMLSNPEKMQVATIVSRVKAFTVERELEALDDDIPF